MPEIFYRNDSVSDLQNYSKNFVLLLLEKIHRGAQTPSCTTISSKWICPWGCLTMGGRNLKGV